ncbi:MAG: hypothetical protein Q9214_001894, partial [Letrouitia sp. 1 TL-2023]
LCNVSDDRGDHVLFPQSDGSATGTSDQLPHLPNLCLNLPDQSDYATTYLAVEPPVIHKVRTLAEVLRAHPQNTSDFRILAIDGVNERTVQFIVEFLANHLSYHLAFQVRVFKRSASCSYENLDLGGFSHQIQTWASTCAHIASSSSERITQGAPLKAPGSGVNPTQLCIYIVPISPLMATIRAANKPSALFANAEVRWRWLVSHWQGILRPDIMINIQSPEATLRDCEVLRIHGSGLDTLVLTPATSGKEIITLKQLRRMCFEVIEWLIQE